eukprot:1159810-Pelagomonas_calceolata.AAC.27
MSLQLVSYAGVVGKECADAIAKHQAIQGNPFHGTTWLAFEEAARTRASKPERPNSPAPKFNYFSNLHDALRTHMHSKHRLGKANTRTGYYSCYQCPIFTDPKKVSNAFWTMAHG